MTHTVTCPGCAQPQRVLYIPGWPGSLNQPPELADWDYLLPRACGCVLTPEQSDDILAAIEAQRDAARQVSPRLPLTDLPD